MPNTIHYYFWFLVVSQAICLISAQLVSHLKHLFFSTSQRIDHMTETRESEFRSPLVNLPLRFGQFNQFNSIKSHLLSTSARYVKGDQLFE
ncbi:hypothetical protein VN97_g3752 [Penicillium thymicola]|uniref:Uncharacterized protein n=1 Tax=Penicillium thymicola TaxID=293382 RepID=A0AAI9TN15_PENTH|nr:hypothetical protein VN97_g3752 [Penicillium thymicola]